MTRWNLAFMLTASALLVSCGRGAEQAAEEKAQALEKRVQELEKQLAAASPAPASPEVIDVSPEFGTNLQPPAGAQPAPLPVPRRQATVRPAPRREPAPPSRSARTQPREPVERLGTDPEGDEGVAGDPGPRREAASTARAERMVLPEGTELTLVLETPVSSRTSHDGDTVVARVERATSQDGRVVLPGGTVLRGRVTEAEDSGRVKGRARVSVEFDSIVVRGRTHPLSATQISAEAPDSRKRDAAVIGGSAAAGAIIGAIKGGKSGAGKGILIGAGAGTTAVLVTKGKEIELPAGSRWVVRVKDSVRL